MSEVVRTQNIRFLRSGPKGEDASSYSLRASVTQIHRKADGTPDVSSFTVTALKCVGDNAYEEWPSGITVQCVRRYRHPTTGAELVGPVTLSVTADTVTVEDGDLGYTVNLMLSDSGTTVATLTIGIVQDGQQGKDGARLNIRRRLWADIPGADDDNVNEADTWLYDGTGSNNILDVAYHTGQWWRCRLTHQKDSSRAPVIDSQYWTLIPHYDNVATGLLLAENAVIDNGIIRNLRTDTAPAKRVEIMHDTNDIRIYGADSIDASSIMSGDSKTFGQLFGGSGGDLADISDSTKTGGFRNVCSVSMSAQGQSYSRTHTLGTVSAGTGLVTGTVKAYIVISHNLTPEQSASGPDPITGMQVPPVITAAIKVNGSPAASVSASMSSSGTVEVPFSARSDGGGVTVTVEVSATGYRGYTGQWSATVWAKAQDMRVDNTKNITYLFANGIATGTSTSNYLAAMSKSDGTMGIKGVSGNGGICIYRNQVYLRLNSQWYACSMASSGDIMVLKLTQMASEPNI